MVIVKIKILSIKTEKLYSIIRIIINPYPNGKTKILVLPINGYDLMKREKDIEDTRPRLRLCCHVFDTHVT